MDIGSEKHARPMFGNGGSRYFQTLVNHPPDCTLQ